MDGGGGPRLLGCILTTTIHPRPSTTHHVWHDTSTPKRDRRASAPCTARRVVVRLLRRRRRTRRKIHVCTTRATTGRPDGTAAATTASHTNIPWWNASTSCWKRSDKVQAQRYVHPCTTTTTTTTTRRKDEVDPQPTVDARRVGKPPPTKTKERHVTWTRK